jgi:hypothetical protein
MLQAIRRHPVPIRAFFRHSLVLTYALPRDLLAPLLPPGLVLDTFGDVGFVAVAMVQTESLRPVGLPAAVGRDFFLTGYRIFTRFTHPSGRSLRGLKILRSDTDRRTMAFFGNMLTHYNYRFADVVLAEQDGTLSIDVRTPGAEADLSVIADIGATATAPPAGSPFADLHEARRFAGPLPFTFDYEPQSGSIVAIEGVRRDWTPRPVNVRVERLTFFDHPPFDGARPVLANAFHIANIDYMWKRGVRMPIAEALA